MSGQKVVDMDVPENGLSEVLRLFIKSRSGHEEEVDLSEGYLLYLFGYLFIINVVREVHR